MADAGPADVRLGGVGGDSEDERVIGYPLSSWQAVQSFKKSPKPALAQALPGLVTSQFTFQLAGSSLHRQADPVLGQINLSGIHTQHPRDFGSPKVLENATIEYLKMFGVDSIFYPVEGGMKEILFPLVVPGGLELCIGRQVASGDRFVCFRCRCRLGAVGAIESPKIIVNPAAGNQQEPILKRTPGRVVTEFRHLPSNRNDGFLHDILRVRIGEAALAGDIVNEAPISLEKSSPTRFVAGVAQPAEQAAAGGHTGVINRCPVRPIQKLGIHEEGLSITKEGNGSKAFGRIDVAEGVIKRGWTRETLKRVQGLVAVLHTPMNGDVNESRR